MEKPNYPYVREDLLENPNTYFYSAYAGLDFLRAWKLARKNLAKQSAKALPLEQAASQAEEIAFPISGKELIRKLYGNLVQNKANEDLLKNFVKRFEVSKRIYPTYEKNMAPPKESRFDDLGLYLNASELFLFAYQKSEDLTYLNCLLKINDTIAGIFPRLTSAQQETAGELFHREILLLDAMAKRLEIAL